jgi:integrase
LTVPPLIRKLDLEDQRPPKPITWAEQKVLMPVLPTHLAKMVLFDLQTGLRENVVCQLRWEWEVRVPLGDGLIVSAFVVPKKHVKGRKSARVVVCNTVAQSIIDGERGKHPDRVFTYRRERTKHLNREPVMPYRPIGSMNNTAWCRGRTEAELGDLHVHDLRHTVGMCLREAGVAEETISDILWHTREGMTAHYSAAQVREIYQAVELIKSDANQINVSLLSLVRESRSFQNLSSKEKGLKKQAS